MLDLHALGCGGRALLAINRLDATRFADAEAKCEAQIPPTGCDGGAQPSLDVSAECVKTKYETVPLPSGDFYCGTTVRHARHVTFHLTKGFLPLFVAAAVTFTALWLREAA